MTPTQIVHSLPRTSVTSGISVVTFCNFHSCNYYKCSFSVHRWKLMLTFRATKRFPNSMTIFIEAVKYESLKYLHLL
jgi:hypothetical protein